MFNQPVEFGETETTHGSVEVFRDPGSFFWFECVKQRCPKEKEGEPHNFLVTAVKK